MVAAFQVNLKGISVVFDYTYVLVLLLYQYRAENLTVPYVMENHIKERAFIDLWQTVQRNSYIVPDRIAADALSECDMVACCFGVGKGTTVKIL